MFVELNRTFHELVDDPNAAASDDRSLVPAPNSLSWQDVLELHRVVILSEAGAGKTEEIRRAAQRLRSEGKAAFFLRLEHVARDLKTAFEEGTFEEFESWLGSAQEGWLLLDSIDESRLRDPSDFEAAVRRLGGKLKAAAQRVHIVLTGRTPAWRPISDLSLCKRQFPFSGPTRSANTDKDLGDGPAEMHTMARSEGQPDGKVFTVVALDDLNVEQVKSFADHKGVADATGMLDEVERADAWSFTARPLDLEELLDYWKQHRRIGSRLDLMRSNIDRRLSEIDQNRDEHKPLAPERVRQGARLLAAACTLTHQQTIAVPDGGNQARGLRIGAVLNDWDAAECATLLQRPIFDEEIYGTVRFHHRSVREYLTAEWFADLLKRDVSRRDIEQVFFREQYGLEVVPPSMRPILPWLAILDDRIQEKARRVEPDLLLSGGDPSQLAFSTRQSILRDRCGRLANGSPTRMDEDTAIQRFAAADLTQDIKHFLASSTNEESRAFLLRMVWQGRLAGALPEALAVALDGDAEKYERKVAFRAVRAVGSAADMDRVRSEFLGEAETLDREWLAELLDSSPSTPRTVAWLIQCLKKVEAVSEHQADHLREQVTLFIDLVPTGELPNVAEELNDLLEVSPVVERQLCEVSSRYRWLLKPAGLTVHRLLRCRDPMALSTPVLAILQKLRMAREFDNLDLDNAKPPFGTLVLEWPELNNALFWHVVEQERQWLDQKNGERLTDLWQANIWRSYVSFTSADFERVLDEVSERPNVDDRLVALTLAFKLYVERGRQAKHRRLLAAACKDHGELKARLASLFHPPPQSSASIEFRKKDALWKQRGKRRQLKEEQDRVQARRYLSENVEALRDPGFQQADAISGSQSYLCHRMRQSKTTKTSSRWSEGNWESLEPEFGPEVARAFRDGAVAYWRLNQPVLLSEGAVPHSAPLSIIFGLTGLAIESRETSGWPESLTVDEARLAFRYAMHELNGFPPWLPSVFDRYPEAIRDVSLTELDWELQTEVEDRDSNYLLYDIDWAGEWLWNAIAPHLLTAIAAREPKNVGTLQHVLNIVQGSGISAEQIAVLASTKAVSLDSSEHLAHWFAVWTGVAPAEALETLKLRIDHITDEAERQKLVMVYLTQLLGGRRTGASKVRDGFRTPWYLKELYLLAHRHMRRQDDTDRANGGVYSPGLRDNAQDAREHLLSLL